MHKLIKFFDDNIKNSFDIKLLLSNEMIVSLGV